VPGGIAPPGRRTRRFGLDAGRRLRRREDFERLLREGKRLGFEGYTFYVGAREAGPPRLGILVSRKHAALATDRNRIKRCVREAFRVEQEGLGAMDVLVRPPYGAKPSAAMITKLRRLIAKLKS
jgi:ribonuclease P protein component